MEMFDLLSDKVIEMGEYACNAQKDITVNYKLDGSAITKTDVYIDEHLKKAIYEIYGDVNIISEEADSEFSDDKKYTFIIDPIDGTDAYSQGLPAWCISVGILNNKREAVGALVYAPRWGLSRDEGLFLHLNPGAKLMMNNSEYSPRLATRELEQIAIASNTHRYIAMEKYKGKIRTFGSNILHMISPLIHPHIQGSISVPCFVWDVAGAHALLADQGFTTVYEDESPFTYTDVLLKERGMFESIIYSGTHEAVSEMKSLFHPI